MQKQQMEFPLMVPYMDRPEAAEQAAVSAYFGKR